jgi:hypothetical protein
VDCERRADQWSYDPDNSPDALVGKILYLNAQQEEKE